MKANTTHHPDSVPVNTPMPAGKCVARFHVDLDERIVNSAGANAGYSVHVEANGLGRFFVLCVIKTGAYEDL